MHSDYIIIYFYRGYLRFLATPHYKELFLDLLILQQKDNNDKVVS